MFDHIRAFHRPTTVADALRVFRTERRQGGRGAFVAGGTDVVVQGDRALRFLVDVTALPLRYIRRRHGGWAIGAASRMVDLERSAALRRFADGALSEAAGTCGSLQIRNLATIGGNLANASPACDTAPPLLALDASVVVAAAGRRRTIPLDRFFRGVNRTALDGGLLVEILIPAPRLPRGGRATWSFQKLGRLTSDIALVNAAVGLAVDGTGRCAWARIALGAVAPTPIRARRAEALLVGRVLDRAAIEETASMAAAATRPVSDVRATDRYRRRMSRVLVMRALEACARRAGRAPTTPGSGSCAARKVPPRREGHRVGRSS
jgi:carbon-monoxide dehydrogenase medium subunit